MKLSFLAILVTLTGGLTLMALANGGEQGTTPPATVNDYKILAPISHGDLTIFPVVTGKGHDTSEFITLDEGIRSGEVVVTEVGNLHSSMRRRNPVVQPNRGAEVNRLVLVNNSKHPLILLAGEVVTGGKQDRVVAKDRIVPSESDPVDLSVFCVEHGRWIETSGKFDTHASVMLQPSVRMKAMAEKDQQQVWDEVSKSRTAMAYAVAPPPKTSGTPGVGQGSGNGSGVGGGSGGTIGGPVTSGSAGSGPRTLGMPSSVDSLRSLNGTTSYAKARENAAVKQQVDSIVQPMQKSYESVIKQLRNQNAVGVVVAVR